MTAIDQERVKSGFDGEMTEQRLDRAKFLLTQTSVSLAAVAVGGGWKTEASFAAVFERTVGVTPVHYRSWHQCPQ